MSSPHQNPEQVARDKIDAQLAASNRTVQDKTAINSKIGQGQAALEYPTSQLIPLIQPQRQTEAPQKTAKKVASPKKQFEQSDFTFK